MHVIVKIGLLSSVFGALISCGGSPEPAALEHYIQQVKSRPAATVPPLPKFAPLTVFEYPQRMRRSPFTVATQQNRKANVGPDQQRQKEPLERYMLDALKMVGTLSQANQQWAIVSAPDGQFYRLRTGNFMGQNYGKIAKIDSQSILVEEMIQVDGSWEKRTAKLPLVEEKDEK